MSCKNWGTIFWRDISDWMSYVASTAPNCSAVADVGPCTIHESCHMVIVPCHTMIESCHTLILSCLPRHSPRNVSRTPLILLMWTFIYDWHSPRNVSRTPLILLMWNSIYDWHSPRNVSRTPLILLMWNSIYDSRHTIVESWWWSHGTQWLSRVTQWLSHVTQWLSHVTQWLSHVTQWLSHFTEGAVCIYMYAVDETDHAIYTVWCSVLHICVLSMEWITLYTQYTTPYSNCTLQQTAPYSNSLLHTTHGRTRQHTASHCNTL